MTLVLRWSCCSPGAAIRRMWDEGFGRKLGEDYVEELAELGAAELEADQ